MSSSNRSCGYVDPGWEHGVAQDNRKKKVRCNYCGKVVSGGIYRLKQHLARLSGEVTCCDKVPDDVRLRMRDNLEGCRVGKKKKSRPIDYDEQSYLNFNSTDDVEDEDQDHRHVVRRKGKQMSETAIINNHMATPLRSMGYVDPGWEHGVPQDERKKKVKCNYCDKVVSGGINRFKQHLARIPGEVAPCKNAPEDVYLKIKENMKWHRTGRRHRRPDTKDNNMLSTNFYLNSDNEDEDINQEEDDDDGDDEDDAAYDNNNRRFDRRTFKGLSESKRPRFDANVLKTPKIMMMPLLAKRSSSSSSSARREVLASVCKFFYHAGVPSQAVNSPYFQKMLEVVSQHGSDLVGPSSHLISGRCLQDEVSNIKNYLNEYKSSWAVTGCSILADSWRDRLDRTLINILVSCPRGVYFVCSVDVSSVVDDASYMYKLLDKVVEEMGEENVVQVITQNTPSYRAAGKMLEERRRNLFWTPCAANCIDQILDEFTKLNRVSDCIEKGQKITKFIYNRIWLLNLMKKEFTGGAELLRPSVTQSASSFTTLQSLLDHKVGLRRLFQSNKWISSRFSKLEEGKEVKNIVLDSSFWRKVQFVRRSVDPLLEVLQKINSDESLSMPFIYNDMYRAKLAIKFNHNDDARKYEPFWSVIDSHWGSLFHHPLYLSAYFLNPSYRYRPDFILHPDVVRGLNACIVRLESDSARRVSASMQISDFSTAKADFGTDLAMSTRSELDPAAWWQQHGINCLELQRIAVRILSQSSSSLGCEHNWSIHDQMYEQRHNRLAQKRLSEAIYVHYNLRLRERQMRKRSSNSVSLDSVLQEDLLYDWIVGTERQQSLQDDEEILYTEMEHEDAYENDMHEFDDGNAESRKGAMEMVLVEPLDVEDDAAAQNDDEAASGDDDQGLNYVDDDDNDDDDDDDDDDDVDDDDDDDMTE